MRYDRHLNKAKQTIESIPLDHRLGVVVDRHHHLLIEAQTEEQVKTVLRLIIDPAQAEELIASFNELTGEYRRKAYFEAAQLLTMKFQAQRRAEQRGFLGESAAPALDNKADPYAKSSSRSRGTRDGRNRLATRHGLSLAA